MSRKDPRREKKRQAKLAKRARKERTRKQEPEAPRPYSGRKYQAERWVPHVYQTELAIYETIQLSGERLTNVQVRKALVHLIQQLRKGLPAALPEGELLPPFASGREDVFLVANIRRHWRILFHEHGPTNRTDLIGILRTLLYSIDAHASPVSPHRGYIDFLKSFMQDIQGRKRR
jgi:hypothetical protein